MARLGDVFTITSGGTPDKRKTSYYENGNIPWIKTGDLKEKFVPKDIEYITLDGLNHSSAKLFPIGTVLVAMYGATIGACSILNYEASTNQACAAFLPSSSVLPSYLYYFLSSRKERFIQDGVGGAQPNISAGYLKNFPFDVKSLDEQEQVVLRLDKINDLISLRKQQLIKLDELVKARFVEMFGDPVRNTLGWDSFPLDRCCDGIGDGLHGTPDYQEDGQYPFINGNNLSNGEIIVTESTKMVGKTEYQKLKIDIADNAILLSINGTLGKLALYNRERIVLGKSACYCNLKNTIDRNFVYALMASDPFKNYLESSSTKSTIKNVGLRAIREYPLILPPKELQQKFSRFAQQISEQKLTIQQSLDKLEMLKKALMQKYFG